MSCKLVALTEDLCQFSSMRIFVPVISYLSKTASATRLYYNRWKKTGEAVQPLCTEEITLWKCGWISYKSLAGELAWSKFTELQWIQAKAPHPCRSPSDVGTNLIQLYASSNIVHLVCSEYGSSQTLIFSRLV